MDNQSNNSDDQFSVYTTQNAKPNNRKVISHKGLCIRSDFPGGNISQASFQQQFRLQGKAALVIQFWGNSDAQCDPSDKSWFYFSVSGIRQNQNLKYEELIFRFKNANTYRKFVKDKKFRPYISYKQENNEWKTTYISKMNILQDQIIQAQFVYRIQPGVDKAYFALHLPYNMSDLQRLNDNILDYLESIKQSAVYYHREIIAQSIDLFPVYMFTITSSVNIASNSQRQPIMWPNGKGNRPFLLKNKPQIVFTSRVHPAETSSSFCVQGIIQSLIKNKTFDLLRQIFIFRIIPMMNPDGVQNGHYRLDNYLQNLNRFYGHSSPQKTPSIFAVQKLLTFLRQKSKLFLFMDIHGHNSPKTSFIFGNYNQNFYQSLENKTFVRVMESLNEGNFSLNDCEFSKKNMSLKQKYDQHSKQASARVFAYLGAAQFNSQGLPKTQVIVQHSYTLQVHPYLVSNQFKSIMKSENSYRSLPISPPPKKSQLFSLIIDLTKNQICQQYKNIGQNTLISILQIIGANFYSYSQQIESYYLHRRRALRQTSKFPQFYDRLKKSKEKQMNKYILDRYFLRWNILQTYRSFLCKNPLILQKFNSKSLFCPLYQIYDEPQYSKKQRRQSGILRNSCSTGKMSPKTVQKLEQKPDVIIHEEDNEHLCEQQRNQNYQFQAQLSRRKSSERNDRKKSFLKSMEYQVLQKIQNQNKKQKQNHNHNHNNNNNNNNNNNQIINACSIKSCSPSINPQLDFTKNQFGYLDRKLKKLIFRHKTQLQKQYYHKSSNSRKDKLPFLYQIQFAQLQNQAFKSEKLKQLQNQYLKINQKKTAQDSNSVKKSKCKSVNSKIQQSNSRIQHISQKIALNWKNFRNSTEHEQLKRLQKMNPRIQHLVKRISSNKQQSLLCENSQSKVQIQKIKSTKAMASNLLIYKSKKKHHITLQGQKYQAYSPRTLNKKNMTSDNKRLLIPLIQQSKGYEKIINHPQNIELIGYQIPQNFIALNQEIKRDKDREIIKLNRKQTNNKLLNFLERSKNINNTRIIQKAKEIFIEKSKFYCVTQK